MKGGIFCFCWGGGGGGGGGKCQSDVFSFGKCSLINAIMTFILNNVLDTYQLQTVQHVDDEMIDDLFPRCTDRVSPA